MKNQDERHELEPGAAEAILTAEIIKLRSDLKAALDGEYLCPNCAHLEAEVDRLRAELAEWRKIAGKELAEAERRHGK